MQRKSAIVLTAVVGLLLRSQTLSAEEHPIFSLLESLTKVQELLEADPRAANARDADGATPLHRIARHVTYTLDDKTGKFTHQQEEKEPSPVAVLLISKGADVNVKDEKSGVSPLHWAIVNRHFPLTKLLVENGADVNATVDKQPGLEGATPLMFAVAQGDTTTMAFLITEGADLNRADKKGNAPLHTAVKKDQLSAAELLLKKGAQTDVKNAEGKTPLSLALEKNRKELVDLLRRHEAK